MATAAVLALPAAASAGYPGANGRIFFDVGGGSGAAIFSIQPDGSDRQRLIDRGREPAVSADGRQIVFMRGGDLYLATRSGSDIVQVTDTDEAERNPSFSPSGNKLLFATDSTGGKPGHIFTMRTDGGDRTRLTQSQRPDSDPSFSPNGNKVVFVRVGTDAVSQLYKMDTDGTNINQLTSGAVRVRGPDLVTRRRSHRVQGLRRPRLLAVRAQSQRGGPRPAHPVGARRPRARLLAQRTQGRVPGCAQRPQGPVHRRHRRGGPSSG